MDQNPSIYSTQLSLINIGFQNSNKPPVRSDEINILRENENKIGICKNQKLKKSVNTILKIRKSENEKMRHFCIFENESSFFKIKF